LPPDVPFVIQVTSALPLLSMVVLGSASWAWPSIAAAFDQPACAWEVPPPPPAGGGLDGEPGPVADDGGPPSFDEVPLPPHAVNARQAATKVHAMGFIKGPFYLIDNRDFLAIKRYKK
jgi:hypothetical protein